MEKFPETNAEDLLAALRHLHEVGVGDVDILMNECKNPECPYCSIIACPNQDPLHFHHDGCPSCNLTN